MDCALAAPSRGCPAKKKAARRRRAGCGWTSLSWTHQRPRLFRAPVFRASVFAAPYFAPPISRPGPWQAASGPLYPLLPPLGPQRDCWASDRTASITSCTVRMFCSASSGMSMPKRILESHDQLRQNPEGRPPNRPIAGRLARPAIPRPPSCWAMRRRTWSGTSAARMPPRIRIARPQFLALREFAPGRPPASQQTGEHEQH